MKRSHSSFTERAANVGPQQRKHQVLGVDYPQTLPSCSGFSTCQEQQPLLHGQPGCLIVSTSRDTSTRWPQGNGGPTYSSVAARGAPIAPLAARTQNTSSGLAQQAGSERLHRTSQIPVLTTCSGLDQSRRKNAVELSMADPSVRSVLPSAQQQQNQQSEQCSAHMYPAAALQLAQRRSQPHLPQQASHVRPSSEGCISRSLEPPLQRQQAPPGLALAQQTDSTRPARASADSAAYVSFLAPGHMTSSLAPAPVASAADLRDQTTNRPAAGFELLPQASNTAADAPSVKPSIGTWAAHSSNSTLVDPIVHIMQNGTGENVHTDSRLDTYTVGSKSATFHSGTGSWPNGDLGQANARAGRQSLPACSGTAPVGPICSEPHDLSCKLTVIQDPPLHYQFHPPRAPQCPAKEHQRPQPQQDRHQVQPVQPRERPFPQQPPQPWQPPAPPPQHLQQQQSNVLSQEKPQQEGCNQRQQPQSNPQQQQQQHHAPPLTLAAQSQAASAITVAAESAPQLSFSSGAQRRLTALPEAAAANGEACNSQEAHAASSLLAFRSGSRDGQRGNGIVESAQPSPSNVMPPAEKLKRPLRMEPSEWIPHAGIVAAFASKGVTKLYPWQAAALECGEDGHNLVYCAPTSGGKSLVAEILMIRRLLAAARARQRQLFNAPQAAATSLFPRALLVLPYVSIVSEKAEHLKRVLAPLRGKVCGYSGMEHTGAPLSAPDEMVAVVTMEKANSTVNRMMAEGRLGELCCVVVDEAHMVGDPHRGICLELCLTKLRFAAAAAAAVHTAAPAPAHSVTAATAGPTRPNPPPLSCQLVCMSATMSGLDDMCGWLEARLFMTNFRPVPLTEYAVFKGKVFRKLTQRELEQKAASVAQQQQQQPVQQIELSEAAGDVPVGSNAAGSDLRSSVCFSAGMAATVPDGTKPNGGFTSAAAIAAVPGSLSSAVEPLVEERDLPESSPKDPDRVVVLVAEVAREGHSTLVFCATRNACQGCAGLLADLLPKQLPPVSPEMFQARRALLLELQDASGGYLSPELQKLIEAGVAYHHAGLTSQERSAVEKGFRGGLIHTLTATSTLAAGINLPARRVILRSLWQGIGRVSRAQYLQMIGRAGRAGQSPIGEAFLIGKGPPHTMQGEWRDVCRLMTARLPPLRCCLLDTPAAPFEDGAAPAHGGGNDGTAGERGKRVGGAEAEAAMAGRIVAKPSAAGKPALAIAQIVGDRARPGAGAGSSALAEGPARAKASSSGGAAAAKTAAESGGETHLQRMLLEAIANGSVTTGATVEALIRSTLLYQQTGYGKIAAATHSALSALRQRRLVTFRPPTPTQAALLVAATAWPKGGPGRCPQTTDRGAKDALVGVVPSVGAGGGAGALWQPTQMGRAIYESCLPTAEGEDLYARLTRALDGLALEGGLHLLHLLINEPLPVEINNWEVWAKMMERMPREPHLRVAEALGVTTTYAQRLAGGRRGNLEESARHWRFASACLMHDIMCEGDPHELELAWGMPGGLTKNGISRGQLQKLQSDLSKWAGMAAVMASSCGWWALQALMEGLSQQAAAGARPELLPLMGLPGMTGARARGLYAAGITRPTLLAVADEEDVKKALVASLPRALRQAKPGKGAKDQGSALATAAAAASGNALLSRGARALVAAARQYVADLAARVAQKEADIAEAELEASGGGSGSTDEAHCAAARRAALGATARLAAELQAARGCAGTPGPANGTACPMAPAAGLGAAGFMAGAPAAAASYRGSARITELSDASSLEAVEAFIQAWRAQPSFALAVISSTPLELEPEQRRLQQLQLGVAATAKAAASYTAGLQAADTDGSRPSAVDTAMIIPGPPGAAMAAQQSQVQLMPSGQATGQKTAADGRVASRNGQDAHGNGRRGAGLGIIEGLVVAWSYTEAFLLTFHHNQPPFVLADGHAGTGGSGISRGDNGVGRKRKAEVQLANRQGKVGPALATAATAARAGVSTVDDADMDVHNSSIVMGMDCNRMQRHRRSALWLAACGVLSAPTSCKVCWHAEAQLAALMLAGYEPAGQWDDPRVMAWLAQGTTAPQDLALQDLRRSLLPSYAVRVPLQHRAAATAACRSALISWALAAPLRAMLVAEGVASHYRLVEAPLTMALARTRINLKPPKAAHDLALSADTSDTGAAGPTGAAASKEDSSIHCIGDHTYGGLLLDEDACRAELSRMRTSTAACVHLISEYLRRPVDLSLPAAVDALCSREYLVRHAGGALTPELHLGVTVGRRPPWHAIFRCKAVTLPTPQRIRAVSVAQLLTSALATSVRAIALESLLAASSSVSVETAGSGGAVLLGPGGDGQLADQHRQPEQHKADTAISLGLQKAKEQTQTVVEGFVTSGHVSVTTNVTGVVDRGSGGGDCIGTCSGLARFALQRLGVEGRLGCVFNGDDDCASQSAYPAADGLVLLTELSSAPVPAPSVQQQYCTSHDAELYLQKILPLPVLFLDTATTTAVTPPSLDQEHRIPDPQGLRPGLLLELQGPSPCMALSFGAAAQAQANGSLTRCNIAVVATTDPLTRQPLRLALPASHVWCAKSCCGADQCLAAARAGQLLSMAMPQVLQCPAEEFLRPPAGWSLITVLYPYLHLAVLAHCSGDERLVEALYQPQPWAAVAASWQESQADQLRRLLPQLHSVPGGAASGDTNSGGGLVSPRPLELAARQVLSRALLGGCSHKELASLLGLTAGAGGGKLAAAALVSSFLAAFPGVARHREDLLVKAKKDGHVLLPSGQHLRMAVRQLNAGGVAAGAKLQRLLCRMQLSAAAAEVVRTAAALAWQRIGQESPVPTPQSPPLAPGQPALLISAPADAPVVWTPAASLVWCDEARATLCVSKQRQKGALREVQDAASAGVMTHLRLRVPLHVSIYHGGSLDLLRCQQYIPGAEED